MGDREPDEGGEDDQDRGLRVEQPEEREHPDPQERRSSYEDGSPAHPVGERAEGGYGEDLDEGGDGDREQANVRGEAEVRGDVGQRVNGEYVEGRVYADARAHAQGYVLRIGPEHV